MGALLFGASAYGCTDARLLTLGEKPSGSGASAGTSGAGASGAGTSGVAGSPAAGTSGGGASGSGGGGGSAGEAGSDSKTLRPLRFEKAGPIAELIPTDLEGQDGNPVKQDNPTLTQNLREIYFTSNRKGGIDDVDVWVARRASELDAFGEPELVEAVSSEGFQSSPAISLDGQTLWVAADLPGGLGNLDIWQWSRGSAGSVINWIGRTNVEALNSPADDLPRQPGHAGGRIMPLNSRRDDPDVYDLYFAYRMSPSQSFDEAPERQTRMNVPDGATTDGFLTNDGLKLFFNAEVSEGDGNLWVAYRESTDDEFSRDMAYPLTDLNTDQDERDPWLSPDGKILFYAADGEGFLTIWSAVVLAPDQ